MKRTISWVLAAGVVLAAAPAPAQQAPSAALPAGWSPQDRVLRRIWEEGMGNSQLERLGQALMDSIGPRLTGTPQQAAAHRWAVEQYRGWGIDARSEQYGTWRGWSRGYTHVDLLEPRLRTLEATMLAWSPGTSEPVTGGVVILPDLPGAAEFAAWLPSARGKFVLINPPQPTCRPDENWAEYALPATFERMKAERTAMINAWNARVTRTGMTLRELPVALENAGAVGVLTNTWSQGWGVDKVFQARTQRVPQLDVSCEDYGLLFRLAQNGDSPVLRVDARAELPGDVPAMNTIGEIRGRRLPNEYVVLSAHFDSWDGASGATDNGTGTLVMMEAMRILKTVYPTPKRTILAGHWSGEEQGLNGSRAFAADHPEVVQGMQVLFNQDNGTGRISNLSLQGLPGAAPFFQRWFSAVPREMVDSIRVDAPGLPGGGGSDHASFICAGAPAFMLGSLSWDYGQYTWHTNRDTYDKVVWDDVRRNAVFVAMLAYLASEDDARIPRDRRTDMPVDPQTGRAREWPACSQPARSAAQSTR